MSKQLHWRVDTPTLLEEQRGGECMKPYEALQEMYAALNDSDRWHKHFNIIAKAISNPERIHATLDIIENRNSKLKINHRIGNRDIANEEIKQISIALDNAIATIRKEVTR